MKKYLIGPILIVISVMAFSFVGSCIANTIVPLEIDHQNLLDNPSLSKKIEDDVDPNTSRIIGTTAQRPTGVSEGFIYYDTTVNTPIYWDGEEWVYHGVLNIKNFGAKGDGVTNDTKAIQSALNIAKSNGKLRLYIPEGVYNTTSLRLYKNSYISLHPNAVIKRIGNGGKVFINGNVGDTEYTNGFNGEGNLHFYGGTIDLNTMDAPIARDKGTTAFDLGHSANISFRNLTIINGQNGHYFQLSSCRDVLFDECWFGDVRYTNKVYKNFELIQIEVATKLSFPTFGGYDGTASRDITIQNCHFENIIRGVGTHSYVKDKDGVTPLYLNGENIRITNNTFKNSISYVGSFIAFEGVVFENNRIIGNAWGEPVYLYQTKNASIKNNYIVSSKND
jgi:hypothetical protein